VPIELLPWALASLGRARSGPAPELSIVAGDASPRRYFRLVLDERSYVLAEAPPATEKNEAFLRVATLLAHAGIKVPAVLDADLQRGFLLLEDLGDRLLLPALDGASADTHYRRAFAVLAKMAEIGAQQAGLGNYDEPLLGEELGRFGEWFVQRLLGHDTGERDQAVLDALFARLIDSALEQPTVLVHRDFHSRNLMLMHDGDLAVIDFQDAVIGPITYDLVSLLRDCYIRWPVARVDAWVLDYCAQLRVAGLLQDVDDARVLRWFDWMGLQRHLKVLGTFARLSLRDGKAAYLDDLPRVLQYVLEILEKYAPTDAAFADFKSWFEQNLSPLIARQPWSKQA
jgi:aminoglycoside/choline kinase family phosphotransferase